MFLQTFAVLGILIIITHLLVYFIFPKTYLETRKQEIHSKANEICNSILQCKSFKEEALSDIIREKMTKN